MNILSTALTEFIKTKSPLYTLTNTHVTCCRPCTRGQGTEMCMFIRYSCSVCPTKFLSNQPNFRTNIFDPWGWTLQYYKYTHISVPALRSIPHMALRTDNYFSRKYRDVTCTYTVWNTAGPIFKCLIKRSCVNKMIDITIVDYRIHARCY